MLPLLPASMRRDEEKDEDSAEVSCAVEDIDGGGVEATNKESAFTEVKWGVDDQGGRFPVSSDRNLQVLFNSRS